MPYRGPVADVLFQMVGGLRSGMGYCGVADIASLQRDVEMVQITTAGLRESHPHDVTITQEAPNYSEVESVAVVQSAVVTTYAGRSRQHEHLGHQVDRRPAGGSRRPAGSMALRRTLSASNLVFLGIGAIIGAGIFVLTGVAAALHAGPAVPISMILVGIACALGRPLLRRNGQHGAGGGQRLHLLVRHDGRAGGLDHRLGPGARVRHGRRDRGGGLVGPPREPAQTSSASTSRRRSPRRRSSWCTARQRAGGGRRLRPRGMERHRRAHQPAGDR